MKRCIIKCLRAYKLYISPMLGPACRFHPTCSEYFAEAVDRWGVWRGIILGTKRLLKCHPWHSGGFDPVPASRSEFKPIFNKKDH
ncbi:membrane protein insertion efficiency factor YidD [bacterium]|nr:membrane protein insertion efficiency factor YidD [candidate division CSSED10-310 bacterium]